MIERNNTNVALDRIFEEVYTMMAEAKRLPLTEKILLDESDLTNVLDDLKEAIPKEIKSATQVLEEQKSIVSNAYAEAERIVQQAKAEAERIVAMAQQEADAKVQEEEIVRQANAVADDIKANALRYQEEIKTAAEDYALRVKHDSLQYADDMLEYLGGSLHSALQGLEDNRSSIREEMRKLTSGSHEEPAEEEE